MSEQSKLLAVHGACALVVALCFVAAGTVLKGQALLAGAVVGVGAWLWGKLGFKPAAVVLERIVFKQLGVSLDDAKLLTTRPPPVTAEDEPTVPGAA